jgi:hypothetical protein
VLPIEETADHMSTLQIQGTELTPEAYQSGSTTTRFKDETRPRRRLVTNSLGFGLVLLCFALLFALAAVTARSEEAHREAYLASAPPAGAAAQTPSGPLSDSHIYFISGCVSNPGDCGKAGPGNWTQYHVYLRELYTSGARPPGVLSNLAFDVWAREHLHFLNARTSPEGSFALNAALRANSTAGDIHLAGSSVGGSAIISYLSQAMRGEVALDPRVRDVLTIDAPLGFQSPFSLSDLPLGLPAGLLKSDVAPGVGEWSGRMGITILSLDTPNDIVGHEPVPGVAHDPAPLYGGPDTPSLPQISDDCRSIFCRLFSFIEILSSRNSWHTYTGDHMSDAARRFIEERWR